MCVMFMCQQRKRIKIALTGTRLESPIAKVSVMDIWHRAPARAPLYYLYTRGEIRCFLYLWIHCTRRTHNSVEEVETEELDRGSPLEAGRKAPASSCGRFSGGGWVVDDREIEGVICSDRDRDRPRPSSMSCEVDMNAGRKKSTPRLRLRREGGSSGESGAPNIVVMTRRLARRTTSSVEPPFGRCQDDDIESIIDEDSDGAGDDDLGANDSGRSCTSSPSASEEVSLGREMGEVGCIGVAAPEAGRPNQPRSRYHLPSR